MIAHQCKGNPANHRREGGTEHDLFHFPVVLIFTPALSGFWFTKQRDDNAPVVPPVAGHPMVMDHMGMNP